MLLGCGQNENGVMGWFFKRLEEGVESGGREHVDLVDDIDLVLTYLWRNAHLFYQLTNLINRVVAGCIQLVDIIGTLLVEGHARFAGIACLAIRTGIETVDGFGKDTGTCRFTHTARTAEEVGVSQFARGYGVLQCSGQCLLSHDRAEIDGAVLTG